VPTETGDGGPRVHEPSFASKIAVRTAIDAGLPVIVQDSPWARAVIPPGAHGCIAGSCESSDLARTAFQLLTNGGLGRARSALCSASADAPRDIVRDVVEAWGLRAPENPRRGASISELKSVDATADSA
jgi:hypothetical protein